MIQATCECGKVLQTRDELAGKRVKCPACGNLLSLPAASASVTTRPEPAKPEPVREEPPTRNNSPVPAVELDDEVLAEVAGKPVKVAFGGHLLTPGSYGGTTLELYRDRVVEKTRHIIARREAELLLTDVESVELLTAGNGSYLALGILTLPILVGLVLIVLYFLFPHRILLIRGHSSALMVALKGDADPYLDFMEATLLQAKRARLRR